MSAANDPLKGAEPVAWNFKLLAQNDLGGFGGMGEGMSVQLAKDGRRIIWLAHESAPKNFTGVDVSDPRHPKVVVQTDLPQAYMRSNSLECSGDIMAVAYQTQKSRPAAGRARTVRHLGAGEAALDLLLRLLRAAFARRASALVLRRRIRAHGRGRRRLQAEPSARRPVLPLHRRAQSGKAGRGRALVDAGHAARRQRAPPPRHALDKGYRAHNTNVYQQRPDRLYLAYIDGGMFIMDIADKAQPKPISHWTNSPPYTGFMHTVMPLFDARPADRHRRIDREQRQGLAEAGLGPRQPRRDHTRCSIATCPLPPVDAYKDRGGRFGAHNLHENPPVPTAWQSDQIVLGTFFNGGLRAYDISNPYQPKEVAAFVPAGAAGLAGRRGPAQRRVRRRARHRLHRRPLHRRALHAGDGFLIGCRARLSAASRS